MTRTRARRVRISALVLMTAAALTRLGIAFAAEMAR